MTTKTYRGRSLEELLPKVRAELGPDAVIVRQREGLTGGVGGFFQKRLVEIEAAAPDGAVAPGPAGMPAAGRLDVRDDSPATPLGQTAAAQPTPDFLAQLTQAQAAAQEWTPAPFGAPPAASDRDEFIPLELPEVVEDDAWSGWRDDVPAPAVTPFATDQVPHGAWLEKADTPGTEAEGAWHRNVDVPGTEDEGAWHRDVDVPGTGGRALPAGAPLAPLPARAFDAEATALRDALVSRGVEGPLADEVVEETVTHLVPLRSQSKLRPLVVSALAQRIPVKPLGGLAGRVVAFVGPGGAGKTHCAGRLAAAYAAADRMPVACVALGARDAGAELALLLAPTGVPLHAASSGADAAARIAPVRDRALVLVDTPGVSPRAKAQLRTLHGELRALGADDVLLALPATSSAGAARDLVTAGKRLGASGVVLTHADETDHIGPAVGVAMESGLPFAYVGRAEELRPAAAEELAGALVGGARNGGGRR